MKTSCLFILTGIFLLAFTACNDWLDVKPADKVSEKEVFNDLKGFRTALNGVYIELNSNSLYGKSLTTEIIEVIAHRYYLSAQWKDMQELYQHNYKSKYAMDRFDQIWSAAYEQIANLNTILKNCEEHREVLTGINYNMVKGEALGLRALLHLDMFRLFGPVYKSDTTALSLPYNTEFSFSAGELLPAHRFIRQVIGDLHEASELLEVDPVITSGPDGTDDENDPMYLRVTRMNYYAVRLLTARAALYAMDKPLALAAAREVIDVQEKWFPFVKPESIKGNTDNPDRVLSSELLFALENPQRANIYNSLFNPDNVEVMKLLAPREEKIKYIFEGEEERDYRFNALFSQVKSISGVNYRVFKKYADVNDKNRKFNRYVPMLRLSEAYYIAAECEENPVDGLAWLNILRNHRGLENVPYYQMLTEMLTTEYQREFFGEGQLFFYYKRQYMRQIINGDSSFGMATQIMNKAKYEIPLPQSEIQYR